MIIKSTDGTAELGIWLAGTFGTVTITTYGDTRATYDAYDLIAAIQEASE